MDFWEQYEQWEEQAAEQLRKRHPEWAGSGHQEICEDGSVYLGNMTWLPAGTVDPWVEETI